MMRQTSLTQLLRGRRVGATIVVLTSLFTATAAFARDVPDKTIPPSVMMEVRVVESEFKRALSSDCAPDRCFVKSCVYENHIRLDQPREASLPGLPTEDGPGSVEPQEFLTRVRCEFAHESTVRTSDVAKLARRLEKRLSSGWLTVVVAPEALEPIPKSLAKSDPNEPEEDEKPKEDSLPLLPPEPEPFTAEVALRQLWDALLPHAPWMAAIFLLTFAVFVLIWAGRRLGAQSIEEKMMEAQIGLAPVDDDSAEKEAAVIEVAPPPSADEEAFAAEQEAVWKERLDKLDPEDDGVISRLLREWLRMGEHATLARALLVFGDRVSQAFEEAPELALKKVEFATYFRDVDESTLPSRAKFFRELNQQSMASMLLSHEDVHLYRSLREDFGSTGFVSLMKELPTRFAALLFALADYDQQQEIAAIVPNELRKAVAAELLSSTRISLRESEYLSICIEAVKSGAALPKAPNGANNREHGPLIDSAGALSILLTHTSIAERAAIFGEEKSRQGGSAPHWYEDIAFNHMLTSLPDEVRNDLLLEIDIRGLAAWLRMQPNEWRKAFVAELSGPLQNALAQTASPPSRLDLVRLAKRGHRELVKALKGAYARSGVKFVDLVS